MIFDVSHRTHYRYASPVVQSLHLVHMSPRNLPGQTVRHHSLLVEPAPASRQDGVDAFGNFAVILDIEAPHKEFVLLARSTVEKLTPANIDLAATTPWDKLDEYSARFRRRSRRRCPPLSVRIAADDGDARDCGLRRAVVSARTTRARCGDGSRACASTTISRSIRTQPTSRRRLLKVFREKRGVCQDFRPRGSRVLQGIASSGALRQRLLPHAAAAGTTEAARGRRLARVDLGLVAGVRLGRLRSDQRHRRPRRARYGRLRPRL